jgi:hypothetical protein
VAADGVSDCPFCQRVGCVTILGALVVGQIAAAVLFRLGQAVGLAGARRDRCHVRLLAVASPATAASAGGAITER